MKEDRSTGTKNKEFCGPLQSGESDYRCQLCTVYFKKMEERILEFEEIYMFNLVRTW